MTEEITISVGEPHKIMLDSVKEDIQGPELRSMTEEFIHNMYQEVEQAKREQQAQAMRQMAQVETEEDTE
jgi:hypothetical protein